MKLLATAAAALVIYFALRSRLEKFTALAVDRFGNGLLIGFIVVFAVPAAIMVLFITVAGWLLALIGMFFYIALIMLSMVLGAVVFSGVAGKYLFKKEFYVTWQLILMGVVAYEVLGLIPLLGWAMRFAFFLSAFGTLSRLIYGNLKKA